MTEEEDPSAPDQAPIYPASKTVDRSSVLDVIRDRRPSEFVFRAADMARNALGVSQQDHVLRTLTKVSDMQAALQAADPLHHIRESLYWLDREAIRLQASDAFQSLSNQKEWFEELVKPTWSSSLVGSAIKSSLHEAMTHHCFEISQATRNSLLGIKAMESIAENLHLLRIHLPDFDEIDRLIHQLPHRVSENLIAVAEAGWYLDPEIPPVDLAYFKEELAEGDPETVDQELANYYAQSLDRLEEGLIERHPTRERHIKSAFKVHRLGEYAASVPLLLALADGICLDSTGLQLFSLGGLKAYAARLEPETMERAYLAPLVRETPMTEGARQRAKREGSLNRHAVLHGESKDYDNEADSLRAISFLNFVSHVLVRRDS